MIGVSLIVFPKLALGLSGFETGVAVMPHVKGGSGDTEARPTGRIRGTHRLLTTAAVIMSVFLITTSFITTLLIPADQFRPGGEANGRALAYLAHEYLGSAFGTVYDVSTIAILWFAGASAMAGLLNLLPRYLPRYGMAPHWARAVRPTVLVLTAVAFLVTWIFDADVDAQGGAYATGVLVLISSAAIAVTIAARRARQRGWTIGFAVIAAVFLYTTALNIAERPDGVKIGACFIAGIILISLASRLARAFELRVTDVVLDPIAERFVRDCAHRDIRLIANEPSNRDLAEYRDKTSQIRADNGIAPEDDLLFVEVTVRDPSDFEAELRVRGEVLHDRYRILTLEHSSGPRATRSPSSCGSSCSARARSPRSPARCSARRSPTARGARACTSAEHRGVRRRADPHSDRRSRSRGRRSVRSGPRGVRSAPRPRPWPARVRRCGSAPRRPRRRSPQAGRPRRSGGETAGGRCRARLRRSP